MDESRRCTAKSKQSQERCKRAAIVGGTVCKIHGGGVPAVKAAAERNARMDAARGEMVTLGLPVDVDPGKALLDEIHMTAGHVQWLRQKVQELEAEDLVWGKTQHEDGLGPQGAVDVTTEKAGPSVWYELYMKEREHLAKVCALALRAGIEERRVKLAEQQGDLVASVVNRILNRLGLTEAQWATVPVIVPEEFRALATIGG